ncbi:MAG: peptide chain release factor N(5)-glutamine methyltransferase [Thermodesulfobacteriota bacterium]|nr:peptide chain release factor N(5)-glutamine methyltransferase [Thermodesulfobacteriota bacterium]
MNNSIWTILRLLNWTTQYFDKNSIENPRLNAEVLLAHSLNTNRIGLYLNYDKPLKKSELKKYKELIRRRIKREPLQYITGVQEFWSLKLKVSKGVLIPRPETEVLIEEALRLIAQIQWCSKTIKILDLATGTGAIAIALAKELKEVSIVATDISDIAIKVAKENAKLHGVQKCITFLKGDMFHPLQENIEPFNLIVSNPPYIPRGDIKDLQPEIRGFEPKIALDGDKDGLRFYRRILPQIGKYLMNGGWLILEVGKGQAQKVTQLIEDSRRFHLTSIIKDFSGIERVVTAQKV